MNKYYEQILSTPGKDSTNCISYPLNEKSLTITQTRSDIIQIMFHPIPENSQVVKGIASFVINGNERAEFKILPQQMQGKNIFIGDVKINF